MSGRSDWRHVFRHRGLGDGNDHLGGGLGADQHIGSAGIGYARYDNGNHGKLVRRLASAAMNVGAAAVGDTYFGIEGIVGAAAAT